MSVAIPAGYQVAESYVITKSAISLASGTAKSIVSVITGSTVTGRLIGFDVTFDGATATEVPVLVEIVRFTTDGTGTGFTPIKGNGEAQNRAALCTSKHTYTVEPTTATVIRSFYIPATSGLPYAWPLGREQGYLPPSTVTTIRCTANATRNVAVNLDFEE